MSNLAVVRGRLSSPVVHRNLASGSRLASLQVTTREDNDAPATSIPVAWFDAPVWVEDLDTDDEVVLIGSIRRRFFRAGGATASRVELVTAHGARLGDTRRVKTVLRRLHDALADAKLTL